jgi:LPS-assembly lipoprotein
MLLVNFLKWRERHRPLSRPVGHPLPQGERAANHRHWQLGVLPSPLAGEGGAKRRERGLFVISILLILTLPLTACFQPLYGPSLLGAENSQLSNIEVAEIPDRIGHFLHAELQFQLGGGKLPIAPIYRLEVKTRSSTQIAIVNRNTDRADSASNVVYADYALYAKDGNIFTQGSVTAVASYDRSAQQFANVRASRNAEERTAKLLAEQIKIRVAAAIAGKK